MKSFALSVLASLIFSVSAHAATLEPSSESLDHGVVAGAFARKFALRDQKYSYRVIAPDLEEPACNPVQIVLWVNDGKAEEGVSGLVFNLGLQVSSVESARFVQGAIKIVYKQNNSEDCTRSEIKTLSVKYKGNGELEM